MKAILSDIFINLFLYFVLNCKEPFFGRGGIKMKLFAMGDDDDDDNDFDRDDDNDDDGDNDGF